MVPIILIFVSLSLGNFFEIPIGQLSYNIDYSEIFIILFSIYTFIKIIKENKVRYISPYIGSLLAIFLGLFLYSIFTYAWSPYGLTVVPGALIFFYGFISIFLANYYLENNSQIYIIAMRIFVLSIIVQLFYNFSVGLSGGVTGFYDLKDYARTLIGKSNFISIFISFDLLYEFISRDKYWKIFFLFSLAALIATISRGAIVSLVIALAGYFIVGLVNKNISKKKLILSFLTLFILFAAVMLFTAPGKVLLKGLSAGIGASTVGTRQVLWAESYTETLLNPLGVGIVWKGDPHNFIFSSLRNLGLFFGLTYIMTISFPIFILIHPKVKYLSKRSIAILLAYLSVVVHSFIEVFFFTKLSVLFTIFTLVYMYISIKQDIATLEENNDDTVKHIGKKYLFHNILFNKLKN